MQDLRFSWRHKFEYLLWYKPKLSTRNHSDAVPQRVRKKRFKDKTNIF